MVEDGGGAWGCQRGTVDAELLLLERGPGGDPAPLLRTPPTGAGCFAPLCPCKCRKEFREGGVELGE